MRSNTVKTFVLLAGIAGLLVTVGTYLAGTGGAVIGLVLGLGIVGGSYWASDRLAVRAANASELSPQEAPELHAMVADLAARAGLPKPRVYLSPSPQPNAFATGRNEHHAVVAVTQGLLDVCDRDELRGVLAHEMAHIRHRDVLIGSVAAGVTLHREPAARRPDRATRWRVVRPVVLHPSVHRGAGRPAAGAPARGHDRLIHPTAGAAGVAPPRGAGRRAVLRTM